MPWPRMPHGFFWRSARSARREQGLFEQQSSAFRTALGELDHRSALATGYCNLAAPDLIRASSSVSLPLAPLPFASARAEACPPSQDEILRANESVHEPIAAAYLSETGTGSNLSYANKVQDSSSDCCGTSILVVHAEPHAVAKVMTDKSTACPPRAPGQDEIFQFYFKHLSDASQQAVLRPEGPTVSKAFRIYHDLKFRGFQDERFNVIQKTSPKTGPNWVRSSGNKVEVGGRIWSNFIGDQPFETVD